MYGYVLNQDEVNTVKPEKYIFDTTTSTNYTAIKYTSDRRYNFN